MPSRLTIIGLGLIGGSLARALKAKAPAVHITAVMRSKDNARFALEHRLVDRVSEDTAEAVSGAELIVLAVPMLAMMDQLRQVSRAAPADAIVTDVGSVKSLFVQQAREVFGTLSRIVPGHPIAGSEASGVQAARADLFAGCRVLLTPEADTEHRATDAVATLWREVGATVEYLSADYHDRVLAATSHLPHVLAYALVDMLTAHAEAENIFRYAAGGFRDFTRIAASDPVMWRDICLSNGAAIGEALDAMEQHVAALRTAIAAGDGAALEAIFSRARRARRTRCGHL